jgi:hypothetical protein
LVDYLAAPLVFPAWNFDNHDYTDPQVHFSVSAATSGFSGASVTVTLLPDGKNLNLADQPIGLLSQAAAIQVSFSNSRFLSSLWRRQVRPVCECQRQRYSGFSRQGRRGECTRESRGH